MKKKISDHISHYVMKHEGNEEKMHELSEFIEDFFYNMDEEYEDVKEAFYEELEDFTEEIDEEKMKEIVENLKKKDGTHSGVKWTVEEVESVCRQYDVKHKFEELGKTYDTHKFWFAMNYVYAVHCNLNRSISGYVDLAIDEITNKNVCFDKLVKHMFKKI